MKEKIHNAKLHQQEAFDAINGLVIDRRIGKKVILDDGSQITEFVSCSYLGLDQDERLIQSASKDLDRYGFSFHAARTRMQPKNNLILESLLNQLYFGAHSLTFPSLHMVHLGFLPILASGEAPSFPLKRKGAIFLLDKRVHSSIQINRGLLKQFGSVLTFDFNRFDVLENHFLEASQKNLTPIAICDSVGSMGGVMPIKELLILAEKYNGYVYLDDAHGTSVHGRQGSGYALMCLDYLFHPRLVLTVTLGKAFGALGGALLLPTKQDRDFTIRFSPTYVFGGPPGLPIVNAAIASANIHLTDEIYLLQQQLWNNVEYFDSLLKEEVINFNTPSPIRGIFIGDEFQAIKIAKELKSRGFLLTTAMYPTVAKGNSILRVAISVLHTKEDIESLCHNVKEIKNKVTSASSIADIN